MTGQFAIKTQWVFPLDTEEERILTDHIVLVKDGKIVKIIPADEYTVDNYPGYTLKEYSGNTVLMPGMINTHTHVGMTLLRGYSDDVELHTWLTQNIWPAEGEFMSEKYRDAEGYHSFVRVSAALACEELLKNGTTTILDMYFHSESSNSVFKETGIRVYNGPSILDFGDGTVDKQIDGAVEYFRQLRELDDSLPENRKGLIRPGAFPHACYTVGEASLKRIVDECKVANKKHGWGEDLVFCIHLHESKKEVEDFNSSHDGESAVDVLARVGAISSQNVNFVSAHTVHLTEAEIKTCASHRCSAAHCPRSNMKLASGIQPAQHYMNNGLNVALGTDSCASNNALSMIAEIQAAALVGKVAPIGGGPTSVSAWTALRMATINGARSIGREHELGSVTEGKIADLVVIDLTDAPKHLLNPVSELVYGANNAGNVVDVWINGEERVVSGKAVTMPKTLAGETLEAATERWHHTISNYRAEARKARVAAVAAAAAVEQPQVISSA